MLTQVTVNSVEKLSWLAQARGLTVRVREGILHGLNRKLFSFLCGISLGDWLRLLRDNHFDVDLAYWPRAALLTADSVVNTLVHCIEGLLLPTVLKVVVQPPVFILGHWRSGTTLLHSLLALDQRFAWPNLFEVCYPHTFLSIERVWSRFFRFLIPARRPMDNMGVDVNSNMEDEFALSLATFCSPYMGWVFPHREEYYDRYLTFRDVPAHVIDRWKKGFMLFLQKLTWKYGRPLLLKSPPHTCRIKLLLEMFPEARFVHICRDPYVVFHSTRHLLKVLPPLFQLHSPDTKDAEERIIRRYQLMYEAYFEERALIPAGRLHEMKFEDLEADPVRQVHQIYECLSLPCFDDVQPLLDEYVRSTDGYTKNKYPAPTDRERRRIARAWQRCFEEWDYPT